MMPRQPFSRSLLSIIIALFLACPATYAQEVDTVYVDEIDLIIGELETLKVYDLTRVSVTDPDIVDIVDADSGEVVVVGKEIGQAAVFVWDKFGKRTIVVSVSSKSVDHTKKRVDNLLKAANIKPDQVLANKDEGKVVVAGQIPREQMILYESLIEPFQLTEDIINLVEQERSDSMIQIDMQITELTQTLTESLGIKWESGGIFTGDGNEDEFTDNLLNPTWTEKSLPEMNGIEDLFKISDFARTARIQARINMIVEEGKGRILSKPKLVVKSGEEATFLVGGEIPVRTTTTSSSGGLQENVEYKEYGIGMTITPTVTKGKVDIRLITEVSEIDRANAVGNDVAFTTRTAQTRLFLEDQQPVVLAGLIKKSEGNTFTKVPLLGDIPVVGALFRNRSKTTPDEDTEIVISLTPTIISDPEKPAKDDSYYTRDSHQVGPVATLASRNNVPVPSEMRSYVEAVQRKISGSVIYPSEAEQYGWEGTVKLGLLILNDGTLAYAMVKQSSGYDIFDDYALNTAKNVAPYAQFPSDADLEEVNVTIPIVYKLN